MSKYQVDKAMREVVLSPEQSAAFNRDPASFLAQFDLSEEERTAMANRDFGALYGIGAHPFLLWGWARCVDQASREDIARRYTQAVQPYGYPDFGT